MLMNFFCIVAATHFHFFFVWQSVAAVCIHFIWHSEIVSSAFKVVSREKKKNYLTHEIALHA